jgi:hypothetical protein
MLEISYGGIFLAPFIDSTKAKHRCSCRWGFSYSSGLGPTAH